jgi:hypothetical protein
MQRTYRRHQLVACLVWCSVVLAGISISFVGCRKQQSPTIGSQPQTSNQISKRSEELEMQTFTVEPGEENDAFVYYKAIFDELGLNPHGLENKALVDSQNLSRALEFLGYGGLKPEDLEDIPSTELMKRFPDDLLSSAFFAPKITDVSVTPINVGWRKVVRLKAKGEAAKKGIAAGFLLFNKFQGKGKFDDNPFRPRTATDKGSESQNTQLILIRADGSALARPIYFLVFGPISGEGKLITFLTASFDARAPDIVKDSKYFVPKACAECHGGLRQLDKEPDYDRLKLNFLDTDHWFDRLNDDFAFLKDYPFGVIFDGDKDETTPKFQAAFDVLRRLNGEIKAQNEKVEPTPSPTPVEPSFQLRAVTKWLELHATDSHHQDAFARALPSTGGDSWKADKAPDKELLPLLNQYCYRCHSSLRFNIFDRPQVVREQRKILNFMNRPVNDALSMPQDRNLDCSPKTLVDKNKILKLVCDLKLPCPALSPTPTPTCPPPLPTP